MADTLQLRGGPTSEGAAFVGALREVTVDTTLKSLRVHDGSSAGGVLLAREDDLTTAEGRATNLESFQTAVLSALGISNLAVNFGSFSGAAIGNNLTLKAILESLEANIDNKVTLNGVNLNATNLGTFTGSTISDSNSIKGSLQELETAAEGEAVLRAAADVSLQNTLTNSYTFTTPNFSGHAYAPEWRATGSGHLKLRAETGNDLNIYLADQETLQITRDPSSGNPKFTAKGGSGQCEFQQTVEFVNGITVGGVGISANTDAVIGVSGAANLGTFTGSTISDNQTIKQALQSLETTLEAVDIDTDDLAALTGIAENITNLGTFTGTTISDNVSVKTALQSLETAQEDTQADVNQNEADADAAIAALQADVDQNESDADAAIAAVQADVDQNEADCDAAIAAVQADVDQNESDADAAIALKANIDDPTFTTKIESPEFHSVGTGHLKFKGGGNDIIFYPQDTETLQITRSGTDCRFTSNGGSGTFKFNQQVDLADGFKLGGTAITTDATELNYVDGVTSAIQTQIDAVQADVNQNETDADAAIAAVQADVDQNEADADTAIALKANIASPTLTGTPAAPTAAAGTNTTQIATTAFVSTAVANTIDGAPGALDTLNELAAALGDDANFSTTITNLINANETHIDNAHTLLGMAKDSTHFGTFTGSTIGDNLTLKDIIQAAETAIELRATSASPAFTGNLITHIGSAVLPVVHRIQGGFPDLTFRTNGTDVPLNANEGRVLWEDAGGGGVAAIKQEMLSTSPLRFFVGGITDSEERLRILANGRVGIGETTPLAQLHVAGSVLVKADFPDFQLRSGGERRLIFQDAGGGAEAAIKSDGANMDIFVGGIASGNEIISIDADSIDLKQTLVIEDGITVDGVALTAIQSSGESFADNDTSLMTSAAIEDRIATTSAATVTKASLDVDHLITLSGVSAAADDLGTFTGSTISDNVTIKAAAQALETALETKFASAGGTLTGNLDVAKSFPDIALKAGDERRILFADAGGSAEGGFKFASNTLKVFSGGGIASGNEAMALNGTTIETKDDLVQNPSASIAPAENGEMVVEATNNTTLTFKLKGSDGTIRTGTITLS